VSRLITFSPTSWLILPWQASPPGQDRGDAANPVISRPGRHLWDPDSAVGELGGDALTPSAFPFRDWHPFTKPVLILTEELAQLLYLGVSPFCTRSPGLVLKQTSKWQSLPHCEVDREVDRKKPPPPWWGFLFTMFPHQELEHLNTRRNMGRSFREQISCQIVDVTKPWRATPGHEHRFKGSFPWKHRVHYVPFKFSKNALNSKWC